MILFSLADKAIASDVFDLLQRAGGAAAGPAATTTVAATDLQRALTVAGAQQHGCAGRAGATLA